MRLFTMGQLWCHGRAPAPPPATPGLVPAREQRLAERLLEDEALRRDLDDATWQPLQDWLLEAARRVAQTTGDLDDAAANEVLDQGQSSLRRMVQVLGQALADGTAAPSFPEAIAEVASLLATAPGAADTPGLSEELQAATQQLQDQGADPATAAAAIAALLREAPRADA
jgi:hypothetical protein